MALKNPPTLPTTHDTAALTNILTSTTSDLNQFIAWAIAARMLMKNDFSQFSKAMAIAT